MSDNRILEICVESVAHAIAAERGGAHRVELCTYLPSGGITPSAGLMQTVRLRVKIPIHVLIRPRAGDFYYSDREFEIMIEDIRVAKQAGMNGIVLGILRKNAGVDIERTKMLVKLAHPLPVTFHRAFDKSINHSTALEEVVQTGASRILTSGGRVRAMDALPVLTRLIRAAKQRVLIMPCGRINSTNVVRILQATSAREIHTSLGTSQASSSRNGDGPRYRENLPAVFEKKVEQLLDRMSSVSG